MGSEVMPLEDFARLVKKDWLAAFLEYSSNGECSPKVMYWVGVSIIGAALQRKVYIDEVRFHWTPNFYILIVAKPSVQRKSTSIDVGMDLLGGVPSVKFGPSCATWQAFLERIEKSEGNAEIVDPETGSVSVFPHSSLTIGISEFGTFFDPSNRDMVDNLTSLWDARLGKFEKATKTVDSNIIVNPFVNWIAGTTPQWFADNFGTGLVGGGLASRILIVHADAPTRRIAYPHLFTPPDHAQRRALLVERLNDFAKLAGPMPLRDDAVEWGMQWYEALLDRAASAHTTALDEDFLARRQTNMHKLAIVVAASRGQYYVSRETLQEADRQLSGIERDKGKTYSLVGASPITAASKKLAEIVERAGADGIEKWRVYRDHFYNVMDDREFERAIEAAAAADILLVMGPVGEPKKVRLVSRQFYGA